MFKKNINIYFLIIFLSFSAMAQVENIEIITPEFSDRIGNGGDAVVCRDSAQNIISVELLDFYEARVERGINISLPKNLSVEQNLKILIDRLGYFDTYTKDKIQKFADRFMNEVSFMKGIMLVEISDSNHLVIPNACKVEQIAIQKNPQFVQDKRYTISEDLWKELDNSNKAGLVFHELIYRLAIENINVKNSLSSRYFVSLVAADMLKTLGIKEYLDFISNELGVAYTDINGELSSIGLIEFNSSSEISKYKVTYDAEKKISIAPNQNVNVIPQSSLEYTLYPSGQVQTLRGHWLKEGILKFDGVSVSYQNGFTINYDINGRVLSVLTQGQAQTIQSYFYPVKSKIYCNSIEFTYDGSGDYLCNINGNDLTRDKALDWLRKDADVNFDRNYVDIPVEGIYQIKFTKKGLPIHIIIDWKSGAGIYALEHIHNFYFYPNGSLKKVETIKGKISINWGPVVHRLNNFGGQVIDFYDNGEVKKGGYLQRQILVKGIGAVTEYGVDTDTYLVSSHYGKEMCSGFDAEYRGYENGNPKFFKPQSTKVFVDVKLPKGNLSYITDKDIAILDAKGNVIEVKRNVCPNAIEKSAF